MVSPGLAALMAACRSPPAFTVVLSASMRDAAKSASAIATTATVCFRFIGASSAALRPMNLESKTDADREARGGGRASSAIKGAEQARRSRGPSKLGDQGGRASAAIKGAEQARPPQKLRVARGVGHVQEDQ